MTWTECRLNQKNRIKMNIAKEQFKKLAKKHLIALQGYDANETIEIFGVEKLYDEIIEIENQKK